MKQYKFLFTIGVLCFFYLSSFSQTAGRKEWVDKDVSIFKHYFEIFPLNTTTTLDDLKSKLKLFKYSEIDSIGFGGVLRWWTCPGGYITIGATILSYKNQIVMVVTTIDNYYISSLSRVFKQDSTLKIKFYKLFTVRKITHDFQDSTYEYTYINQPLFEEYKNHISEFLGKQTIVNTEKCQFEYNLLNSPVSRYQLANPAHKNYPPNYAVTKLKNENRVDCFLNIIRGYSLTGRIYGIRGLLELVKEGKYILTKDDKELIKKVLSLNLTVEEGSIDLIAELKYNECIQPILL